MIQVCQVGQKCSSRAYPGAYLEEGPHVDLRESLAVCVLLVAIPSNRLAATALAELLSRQRSCEQIAEALVRWARAA
jgi:hypothetical protein